MKKMLSKVLALTLCVALGLSLVGGAFAAKPQTGTFDLESTCFDYGQAITKVVINLDTPVGEVTEEEVVAAFSVMVLGCDYNSWGTVISGDNPRTITGATVSEDGETITLELDGSFAESTLGGTVMYNNNSTGYGVTLTQPLGNLTTDLELTFGKLYDPIADKWAAVDADNENGTYAYRWFDPETAGYTMPDGGYPVIVWIHGAGEWGSDNNAQLTANRVTAWGEAETQDIFGGAYVIAPQADRSNTNSEIQGWNGDAIKRTIETLIATVGEEKVNRDDIVIGGCSAGGAGTWSAILANPDYYAAAFPICPASQQTQLTEENLELLDMPIYLTHSIDDTTVNVSTSITSYNTLKAAGKDNIYLGLFEHVAGNGVPAEVASFLGHWSWMYNHNNFDGTEEWWLEEYTHTDGVVYETTTPAELGYETFKHWLAAQVKPDTYFTRDRDVMAYGETINGVTVYGLERIKATQDVADYLIANPIVVTVDGEKREIVDTVVGEDRTSITFVFAPAGFTEPAGSVTAKYVVTVNGEEIPFAGDESDTSDFLAKTYTTPEYTRSGQQLTSMNARYFVPDKEVYPVPEEGYPLVVWLHGGGETGTDNRKQIAANDVHAWTEAPSQEIFGGAYVLAPQNHAAAGLGAPAATMSVIEQFIAEMGDVDMNRIYVGGCSYGGGSTWTMLKTYPNFFAAGFPHCGGTTLSAIDATNLINTPIYISVSTGDGNQAGANFISLYNQLKAAGSEVVHIGLFEHSEFDGVEYFNEVTMGGTEGVLDHWVWVYFHEDFDGVGDDWDGQNWIANDVDATYQYDGRRVEVKDGVLTAIYNVTDAEGNVTENSVVLEGKTENPVDLGYTSFKAWLADQKKSDEYITLNKTVEAWGEIVSSATLTLETPVVDKDSITVTVTASVLDWATMTSEIQSVPHTITDVVVSEDGKTVELTFDKAGFGAPQTTNAYLKYEVSVDGRVITDIQGVNAVDVDKFEPLTFTTPAYTWSGSTRTTMNARAYTPDKEAYPMPEGGYPLVVWLHGGGETGTDNRIQVAANDVPAWTEAATQDIFGGAYVLAPQNHASAGAGAPAATMSVIEQFVAMKGDINVTKIYVGGCSYGGIGTWQMLRNYPNFFAAGYPICCGPSGGLTDEEAASLVNTPIYMVTATGDSSGIVSGMIDAYNDITAAGGTNVHFAMFEHSVLPGLEAVLGVLDHWSWIYVHNDFDGTGEDYDGQMFIDTTVDGTYNDGAVVVADGVLTYTYTSGEETVSISLNGKTERPADLGAETFKTWLANQTNLTPSVFKDVTGATKDYLAIMSLYVDGLTNGTGDGYYSPDATLTRAEFMTFLARAVEATVDNTADTGFTDVAVDSWETGAIAWGVANELIEGYGDDTFGPKDPVTEEQVNLIIGRLIEKISGVTAADGQTIADATDTPATRGQVASVIKAVADNYTAPGGWWW